MAERTLVTDGSLSYFEATVPGVEVCIAAGLIMPVLSHYGGDFANANMYKPTVSDMPLKHIRQVMGADALSEIQQGRAT